jgi:archaellum component FlaF (FlaF/FlaG flagellin family)
MHWHFQKLFRSRRAVSAVISNIILIAAVIVVGFVMLGWSQSQSAIYNNQYSNAVKSDTDQLRERVVFEYIYYDKTGNILTVYLMNSGTIGGVSITTAYVNNTAYAAPALCLLSGTPTLSLNATQEGYFSISPSPSLTLQKSYPITIVTGRGSSFVATFYAS